MDRSARELLSAALLTIGVALAAGLAVNNAFWLDYWLAAVLIIVGLVMLVLSLPEMERRMLNYRISGGRSSALESVPSDDKPAVREYLPATVTHEAPIAAISAVAESAPVIESAPEAVAEAIPAADDDLLVIDGIGPKVKKALNAAGITAYAQLASMNDDQIHAILSAEGVRVVSSAGTWSQQAAYLADGDYEGFTKFNAARKSRGED
jgi:predicted flap endonuclease-1-like 5' DNA nuclease